MSGTTVLFSSLLLMFKKVLGVMLLWLKSFPVSYMSIHDAVGGVGDRYHVHNLFFNILFLLAGVSGLLLSTRLFVKSRKSVALSYLAIFVLAISLAILELVVYWSEDWQYNPAVPMYRLLFFLWAPSIYLFIRMKLYPDGFIVTVKEKAIHYGLFFLCFFSIWYIQSSVDRGSDLIYVFFDFLANSVWFKVAVLLVYFILMYRDYMRVSGSVLVQHKKYVLVLFVYYLNLIGLLVARALLDYDPEFVYIANYAFAVLFAIFILFTGLIAFFDDKLLTGSFSYDSEGVRAVGFSAEPAKSKDLANFVAHGGGDHRSVEDMSSQKYKNSGLTDSMLGHLKLNLVKLLEEDKVYLENDITLDKLAQLLNTDRYSASQVINQEFGKSFYELLNDYRVDEVKRLLSTTVLNESVIQLAYSVGFSNRVSFNKAFKKRTGKTPTEYMANVGKEIDV